ncbi:MAG: low molecular weight protein tyrosine phosphatase family protein [Planctomycetaceae bacterium]
MCRILFLCGRNRWQSPTAEQMFANHPGVECASAGISSDADNPATADLVEWADTILVMERKQQQKLSRTFRPHLRGKRVVCLDIPDKYEFMDPHLIELLAKKVGPLLP